MGKSLCGIVRVNDPLTFKKSGGTPPKTGDGQFIFEIDYQILDF